MYLNAFSQVGKMERGLNPLLISFLEIHILKHQNIDYLLHIGLSENKLLKHISGHSVLCLFLPLICTFIEHASLFFKL